MAAARKKTKPARSGKDPKRREPQWTDGLKQLYNSVVDEPLPDAFANLLARLDDAGS